MKKLFNFLAIAFAGVFTIGMIACTEVVINTAPASLEFDADGVAVTGASVTVTGSDWNATSTEEWITITPASGADGGSFTVSVTANTGAAARNGSVTVTSTSGDDTKTVAISQAAPEAASLTVDPASLEFDADGTAVDGASVTVTGSAWSAISTDEWITIDSASGADGESFTVSVDANTGDEARNGSVTVTSTSGAGTKTVDISQNAPVVVDVTGVELDDDSAHLIMTDEDRNTMTLTATVLPAEATNRGISWSSSAESVATVVDGLVTAVAPGNCVITVTTDQGDFTEDCAIIVTEHGFIIAEANLPGTMDWDSAQTACPAGWRVPSGEELQCMCRTYHHDAGEGADPSWPIDLSYWSSSTAPGIFGGETGARVNFYTLSDPDCTIAGAMMNSQQSYVRCIQDVEE